MNRLQFGAAGGIVVVVLGLLWLVPRAAPPPTEVRMFPVSAGDVRRAIVTPKLAYRRRVAARRVHFAVATGTVEAYLMPFEPTDPTEVARMLAMTEALATGTPPAEPIVSVPAAPSGEIDLPTTLRATDYLLLLRVDSDGELTVRISYGAD